MPPVVLRSLALGLVVAQAEAPAATLVVAVVVALPVTLTMAAWAARVTYLAPLMCLAAAVGVVVLEASAKQFPVLAAAALAFWAKALLAHPDQVAAAEVAAAAVLLVTMQAPLEAEAVCMAAAVAETTPADRLAPGVVNLAQFALSGPVVRAHSRRLTLAAHNRSIDYGTHRPRTLHPNT